MSGEINKSCKTCQFMSCSLVTEPCRSCTMLDGWRVAAAPPCDGAVRCPQADDVTCEECGYSAKYMTMDEKESQKTRV